VRAAHFIENFGFTNWSLVTSFYSKEIRP